MPLQVVEPPSSATSEALTVLQAKARDGQFHTEALAGARPDALELTSPHPVYNLGLDAIAEGASLSRAEMTGWRYLVSDGATIIAAAEVAADPSGAPRTFSHFNVGPFVGATTRARLLAEQVPEVAAGSYELRLLRAPAIDLMALWLKDLRGDNDLIVPMEPAPPQLVVGRTYAPTELLSLLHDAARQRMEFDNTPGPDTNP